MLDEENIRQRIRWLMVWRLFIVTLLLGLAALIEVHGSSLLPEISLNSLYAIIILTYLLTIIFTILLQYAKSLILNVYVQTMADVLVITSLVYITGGIRSVYPVFYPLVIIYAVLFLGRRGGLITASVCSILYGLLLDFEYFGIIQPIYAPSYLDYTFSAGYVFSRILIYIASFFIVAFLASFVVEQEKRTRTLLLEKESAFNQLDILHKSIIDSVDAGIFTIDVQGRIKSFNHAAERITGYVFDEVANEQVNRFFPEFERSLVGKARADNVTSGIHRMELPFLSKQRKHLILGCSVSPLQDQRQKRIGDILIFQDLTAVRTMEKAMEESRRLAFIGEMAAGLAHEIRNPLASIGGSIQVLKQDLKLGHDDERLMQIILRGKDQLEGFLKDFLLLARAPAEKRERVFLDTLIHDVTESLTCVPDWHERIRLITKITPKTQLIANPAEIRQVIWNLVLNALQAMPEGGELRIQAGPIILPGDGEGLEIIIADQGEGIDETQFDKIFTPFYTTKERGTGLGLAIVHRIVISHGGYIRVTRNTGEGTSFCIHLPRGDENMQG